MWPSGRTGPRRTIVTATTDTHLDLTATVDAHLSAYCDPDPVRRAEQVASVWAADGELLDPPLEGHGRDEIVALTDAVLGQFPGHRFERTTAVDEHHGWARYGWSLVDPDGAVVLTGTDVAQLDDEGQLTRIVGFFGEPAPIGA
jgi:hypothetical protein